MDLVWDTLLFAYMLAAACVLGLTLLTSELIRNVDTARARATRKMSIVVLATCALLTAGTFALWSWSWRYFPDEETATGGTPPQVDRLIDIGIASTAACLVPALVITGLAFRARIHNSEESRLTKERR